MQHSQAFSGHSQLQIAISSILAIPFLCDKPRFQLLVECDTGKPGMGLSIAIFPLLPHVTLRRPLNLSKLHLLFENGDTNTDLPRY